MTSWTDSDRGARLRMLLCSIPYDLHCQMDSRRIFDRPALKRRGTGQSPCMSGESHITPYTEFCDGNEILLLSTAFALCIRRNLEASQDLQAIVHNNDSESTCRPRCGNTPDNRTI